MKRVGYLTYLLSLSVIIFLFTSLRTDQNYKKYGVESGYISYVYEGKASGDKKVYFKDWGMTEIQIDNMHIEVFGMTQKTNNVILLQNMDITIHNKVNKKTHREKNTHIESLIRNNPYETNLVKTTYLELEKDGGKQYGTRKYLDKECELWEINGSRQLVWKGIPLKTELEVAGLKIIMRAIEIKTNITIPDSILNMQKNIIDVASKI